MVLITPEDRNRNKVKYCGFVIFFLILFFKLIQIFFLNIFFTEISYGPFLKPPT